MIITITFNPALDKTVEIDNFNLDKVNRISSIRLDAGGKGINVSKVIKVLGGESKAVGILAGRTGDYIKRYLDSEKIENDFIFIEGETRTNIKIIDKFNHTNTDVNECGPKVSEEELQKLWNKLSGNLTSEDIVIFSGSIPGNLSKGTYGEWISKIKEKGAKTILDADGEVLKIGINSAPYLIKPNIHEIESMFEKKVRSIEEVVVFSKSIIESGVETVAVSLGKVGAIFVNKEYSIYAHGIETEVKSTVGAGDSMVAALAYSIDKGYSFEKAAKLAVATGTANVMTSGTEPGKLETIIMLEKQVKLEYL